MTLDTGSTMYDTKVNVLTRQHQTPYLHHKFTTLKPVGQFLKLSNLSAPKSLGEWKERVVSNLNYFHSNYLVIMCLVSLFKLFQNLYLLLALTVLSGGLFALQRYDLDEFEIAGQTVRVNKNYTYVALLLCTVPVILVSSPIGTMLSLLSLTAAIVVIHASVFDSDSETGFNDSPV